MVCLYRPQTNSLWSIWYCVAVLALNGYLIYLGLMRYTAYTETRWPLGYPTIALSIFIGLHGLIIVMSPFFIAATVFKVGNYANDGEKLGEMGARRVIELTGRPGCSRRLKAAWQHGPPVAQAIHLIMAYTILMANSIMTAQLFRSGIYKPDPEIWTTDDVDFLFYSHDRFRNIVPNASISISAASVPPKLLPVLLNSKLYGISFEFYNYLFALLIFAVTYPAVFWRTSKAFGFLFSCHLLTHLIEAVFGLVGFNILYRIQVSDTLPSDLRKHGVFLLNDYLVAVLALVSAVLVFFASAVVYGYGYNKYCLSLLAHQGRYKLRKTYAVCCEGYSPHIVAILVLILMVACKAPVLYDLMILYQNRTLYQSKILTCIVIDVSYLFTWILLWLALTLKRDWQFITRYSAHEVLRLMGNDIEGRNFKETAAIVICGNETFVTDEPVRKQALLGIIEKARLSQQEHDVYWLRPPQASIPETVVVCGKPPLPTSEVPNHVNGNGGGNNQEERAAAWRGTGKQKGYQKVSFDYDDDPKPSGTPVPIRGQRPLGPSHPGGSSATYGTYTDSTNRKSGSYLRFHEDNNCCDPSAESATDPVTTFGTLPRGEQKRRKAQEHGTTLRNHQMRAGSETIGAVGPGASYSMVQKGGVKMGSASPTNSYRAPVMKPEGGGGNTTPNYARLADQESDITLTHESNVSRASSYTNMPGGQQKSHSHTQYDLGPNPQYPQRQYRGQSVNGEPYTQQAVGTSRVFNASYASDIAYAPHGQPPLKAPSFSSVQSATPVLGHRSRTSYSPAVVETVPVSQQGIMVKAKMHVPRSPSFERRLPEDEMIYGASGYGTGFRTGFQVATPGSSSTFTDNISDAGGTLTRQMANNSSSSAPNSSREATPLGNQPQTLNNAAVYSNMHQHQQASMANGGKSPGLLLQHQNAAASLSGSLSNCLTNQNNGVPNGNNARSYSLAGGMIYGHYHPNHHAPQMITIGGAGSMGVTNGQGGGNNRKGSLSSGIGTVYSPNSMTSPSSLSAASSTVPPPPSQGAGGGKLNGGGYQHHERKESGNYSLTSSENSSERDHQVQPPFSTSVV